MRNLWTMPTINTALKLRAKGLSYPALAIVLNEYHGMHGVTGDAVRTMLRKHGAIPVGHGQRGLNFAGPRHQGGERAARPDVTAPERRPVTLPQETTT